MSKRKIRGEDGCDQERKMKANYVPDRENKTIDQGAAELRHFSISKLRFATESWAGMKTNNEDRHVMSDEFFPGPALGIFDGHGGAFSADFLTRQLVKTTASVIRQHIGSKALSELQRLQELSGQESSRKNALADQITLLQQQLEKVEAMHTATASSKACKDEFADELVLLVEQLTEAILQMKTEVEQIDIEEAGRRKDRLEWFDEHHNQLLLSFKDAFERVDAQILLKNPSQDGSTALVVWFLADTALGGEGTSKDGEEAGGVSFYTVNVGDCRAVMCRGGRAVPLTSDHKPDRPDEKQRIEKAGGFVGKIAGISRVYSAAGTGLAMQQEASTYLAVSRAFGDRSLKTPTALVSCEPEVKRYQVQRDDLFLVLACDGVWDVLSEQKLWTSSCPTPTMPKLPLMPS